MNYLTVARMPFFPKTGSFKGLKVVTQGELRKYLSCESGLTKHKSELTNKIQMIPKKRHSVNNIEGRESIKAWLNLHKYRNTGRSINIATATSRLRSLKLGPPIVFPAHRFHAPLSYNQGSTGVDPGKASSTCPLYHCGVKAGFKNTHHLPAFYLSEVNINQ